MNKARSEVKNKSKQVKSGQKRIHEKDSFMPKKSKKMKVKHKPRQPQRYSNECAEGESSRIELQRFPRQQQVRKVSSDNSVIYVSTYHQTENIAYIDLTKSSQSVLYKTLSSRFSSSTSLKLIYKSNNFNRLQKHLTGSLVTIPLRKNIENNRNTSSTSNFVKSSREKLAVLDIPPEYFDEDTDGSDYALPNPSLTDLNEEDINIIENMLTMEENTGSTTFNLECKDPIEDMMQLYGTSSDSTFD